MRALIVCITLLFAFLTCTMAQIPSVKVENTKGAQVNTSSLINHKTPMIISFWATTCKPCIRELDAINEQLPDWLEEANFRVVAVSTDDAVLLLKRVHWQRDMDGMILSCCMIKIRNSCEL